MSSKNTFRSLVASIAIGASIVSMSTAAAVVARESTLTCPTANGTSYTSDSTTFTIECGFDRFDSDMSMTYAYTLEQCMDDCVASPGCVDVSWIPGNAGPCYLKKNVGQVVYNEGVWGARSNRAVPLTCPSCNGTMYATGHGRSYIIECGLDHFDNDFITNPTYVSDLEGCIAACNAQPECVDVSLSDNACYLKRASGTPVPHPGLSGARCFSGCSSAPGGSN